MPGFDPNEPRDPTGKWTASIGSAIQTAASDAVKNLMVKAKDAVAEVQEEVKKIADEIGGTATPVDLKREERIVEKAKKEYGGAVDKIKDAVRSTIIVDYSKLNDAVAALQKRPEITRVKIQNGSEFFGYEGVLANMKTKNGIEAEIQVNFPEMLYAKEDKRAATKYLSEEQYNNIKAKTGLEGGVGHKLYDEIRSYRGAGTLTPEQQQRVSELVEKSEEYYSHFKKKL